MADQLLVTDGKTNIHITREQANVLQDKIIKSPNGKKWFLTAHSLHAWASRQNMEPQLKVPEEQFLFLQNMYEKIK